MTEAVVQPPEDQRTLRPAGDIWVFEDLSRLPEDTNRYQIVDGSLLVSPAPNIAHLIVVATLRTLLATAAPATLRVFENAGVVVGRSTWIPDLVIVRESALRQRRGAFESADVVLAVEVLSPSNRMTDLVTKRSGYASGGIRGYWIVDPEIPSLTVLALRGEVYAEAAVVTGVTPYNAEAPFPVRVLPTELIADLHS